MPTFPIFLENLGAKEWSIGVIHMFFALAAILLRIFCGKILDEYGRWWVCYLGGIIFIISVFSFNIFTSLLVIFIFRLIHGVGWGIVSTANNTIASDIIPKRYFGRGMAVFTLALAFSLAIGPYFGLWLMQKGGFSLVAYVSCFLAFLSSLAVFVLQILQREPFFRLRAKHPLNLQSLFEKTSIFPTIIMSILSVSYGALVTFVVLYANSKNIENVGMFFVAYAIVLALSRPLCGYLVDKIGHYKVVIISFPFFIISLVILALLDSFWDLIISAAFFSFGFGSIQLSLQTMAIVSAPKEKKGVANSTFLVGFDAGIGFGAMIGGVIATSFGYSNMFWFLGFISLFLFCYLLLKKEI